MTRTAITIAALCAVLCAWPVAAQVGSTQFTVYKVGQADTSSSRQFSSSGDRVFLATVSLIRPDTNTSDSIYLTGQYAYLHPDPAPSPTTTRLQGQKLWKDFGFWKFATSDSAAALWPKVFKFSDADSTCYGVEVRWILKVSDDATTDSLLSDIGAGWLLNVRGIR